MTHLKARIIIGFLLCFFTTNTHAQTGVNIDSVRKVLFTSQQTYRVNSLSKKPVSCVFATNNFKETYQNINTPTNPQLNASDAIFKRKQPITGFTDNIEIADPTRMTDYDYDLWAKFYNKSNTSIFERAAAAILLFGQNR